MQLTSGVSIRRGVPSMILRPLDRLDKGLARFEAGAGCAILLALIVVLSLQVASRQLPFFYISWTEEASRFLFAWLAFLGTALAYQRKAHVAIDFLVERAPPFLRASAGVFVHVIIVSFAAIMLFYGLRLCLSTQMVSTVLMAPMWVPYAAIPVSGALMIVHGLVDMLRIVTPTPGPKETHA